MAFVLVDQDLATTLDDLTAVFASNMELRLYTAIGGTPGRATVLADLTQATFSGYSAIALNDFGAGSVSGNIASAISANETFSHNGGGTSNTILGYYVVDTVAAKLWGFEPLVASKIMAALGDTITIGPTLTLRQLGV